MKYLHLIWAALFRRKGRTFLTLVSIITAFLLFGLLDAARNACRPVPRSASSSCCPCRWAAASRRSTA
jgi:putative ABC transport system permease protein